MALFGMITLMAGLMLRLNALAVLISSGVIALILSGESPLVALELLGSTFIETRYMSIILLLVPAIGILEGQGLADQIRSKFSNIKDMSASKVFKYYLLLRQITCAFGLNAIGGTLQLVKPVVVPLAELHLGADADAKKRQQELRSVAAATDNVGRFFGETLFFSNGAVLLVVGFFQQHGIILSPSVISLSGLPICIFAFVAQFIAISYYGRT